MGSQPSFTQPPQRASFSGFLFDMDGTIIDSTAAIVKHWHRSLIDSLIALSAPWAIVTSGTEPLVSGWLSRLSLAVPRHLVTAESVADGKPDPACYRMGLDKLNLAHRAGDVVVLEDAPAGIEAGKAAGCKVIGLVTSHTVDQVVAAGPDWVVKDLESVRVVGQHDGRVTVEISNALRL
ncbi:hypothetical protein UVI_02035020 [Ustilaginoidea virens]|uniref:Glycerol-3-phosphate phosphatase n=1 Tax=Ustilaginoidea virens TaxID=1159556 RepID=A0A1B5KVH5_USTVR|nr:hypothetical protein UVI_02035020 [Ustilaginoidea virens]